MRYQSAERSVAGRMEGPAAQAGGLEAQARVLTGRIRDLQQARRGVVVKRHACRGETPDIDRVAGDKALELRSRVVRGTHVNAECRRLPGGSRWQRAAIPWWSDDKKRNRTLPPEAKSFLAEMVIAMGE
jgi:hypothetical protein